MIINTLIISIILVAIVMLAMGVKLLFNKDAEFSSHSCAHVEGSRNEDGACSKCEFKDLVNCPEDKKS